MARLVIHQDFIPGVTGRHGDIFMRFTDADGEAHVFQFSVPAMDEFMELIGQAKQQALGIKVEGS